MTFEQWFDDEFPITETTNISLREAMKALMRKSWDAAFKYAGW